MKLFRGLCAFPLTPLNSDAQVDAIAFRLLVRDLAEARVNSLGVLGSTGLYAFLDRDQRRRAVSAAVDGAQGKVPLVVGVGALRTDLACSYARDAAYEGADALLLAPVSYTPLTDEEVFQHFFAVASATPLPVCIYNNPFTTNFRFSAELIARLAQLPSLKAVKMPLPLESQVHEELSLLRTAISDDSFAIGYSGDWGAADALLSGADAWFSVIGGIYPRIALALTRHAQGGDGSKSAKLNSQLEPLWRLFREFGGLRVVHSLITRQRLPDAHLPRPLLPIPAAARERLDQIAPRMERLEVELKGN